MFFFSVFFSFNCFLRLPLPSLYCRMVDGLVLSWRTTTTGWGRRACSAPAGRTASTSGSSSPGRWTCSRSCSVRSWTRSGCWSWSGGCRSSRCWPPSWRTACCPAGSCRRWWSCRGWSRAGSSWWPCSDITSSGHYSCCRLTSSSCQPTCSSWLKTEAVIRRHSQPDSYTFSEGLRLSVISSNPPSPNILDPFLIIVIFQICRRRSYIWALVNMPSDHQKKRAAKKKELAKVRNSTKIRRP